MADITVSNFAYTTSNQATHQAMGTNPLEVNAGHGYCGTFNWFCTTGQASQLCHLVFQVYKYNTTTDEWDVTDWDGDFQWSQPPGVTDMAYSVDFVDSQNPLPTGETYCIAAWLAYWDDEDNLHVMADTCSPAFYSHSSADDPLPDPEESPLFPEGMPHPTSGPIGPGTS